MKKTFVFFALCIFATSSTFLQAQYQDSEFIMRYSKNEIVEMLWEMTESELKNISQPQMQNIKNAYGDLSPLLLRAVESGHCSLVKVLLDCGANPQCDNKILFSIPGNRMKTMLPLLLGKGADINVKLQDINPGYYYGLTVFSLAIVTKKKELLPSLYPFIDDMTLTTIKQAFGLAEYTRDEVTKKKLIEHGINKNIVITEKHFPEYWKKILFNK